MAGFNVLPLLLSNIQKTLCDVLLNDGFEEHTHDAILLVFMMRMFILPIYQFISSTSALFVSQNENENIGCKIHVYLFVYG